MSCTDHCKMSILHASQLLEILRDRQEGLLWVCLSPDDLESNEIEFVCVSTMACNNLPAGYPSRSLADCRKWLNLRHVEIIHSGRFPESSKNICTCITDCAEVINHLKMYMYVRLYFFLIMLEMARRAWPTGCTSLVPHLIGPPSLVPHLIGPPSHWSPNKHPCTTHFIGPPSHWSPRLIGPPSHWSPISLVPFSLIPQFISPPLHYLNSLVPLLIGPPFH